jgi:hypothetical protein
MAFVVRPGKYLIEKTRRKLVGAIAYVGTGGSVPAPVQAALDGYAKSLAARHRRADAQLVERTEKKILRAGMKKMQGTWLIVTRDGVRWAHMAQNSRANLRSALKSVGWSIPVEQLDALLGA